MKQCNHCGRYYPDTFNTCTECHIALASIEQIGGFGNISASANGMLISNPVLEISRTRPASVGREHVIYRNPAPARPRRQRTDTRPMPTADTRSAPVAGRQPRSGVSTIESRRSAVENRRLPDVIVNAHAASTNTPSPSVDREERAAGRRNTHHGTRNSRTDTAANEAPTFRQANTQAAAQTNRQANTQAPVAANDNLPSFRTETGAENNVPGSLFEGTGTAARPRRRALPTAHPMSGAIFSNIETVIRFLIPIALAGTAIYFLVTNWEAIKAIAAVFAVFWIIGFGLTLVFSHRFFQIHADTLISLSTIIAIILILLYYNVAGIGSGVAAIISSVIPIVLTVAAICYLLRLLVR